MLEIIRVGDSNLFDISVKQFERLPINSTHEVDHSRERERSYLPLITDDENRAIEASGGEYRGFVKGSGGAERFEDILISRHTYYDEAHRNLVEAFIATEAVNEEGGNELDNPADTRGFSTIITRTLRSGKAIAEPQIISISAEDLTSPQKAGSLRFAAREAHHYIVKNVAQLEPAELDSRLKRLLKSPHPQAAL